MLNYKMAKNFLGKGEYGEVIKDGQYAVKKFNRLSSFINEVFVTKYVSGLPYVISIKGCKAYNLTMRMDLWHTSLDKIVNKLNQLQKQSIYICILKALESLESRYIVHADLKLSNILVNSTYDKAIIADFGISSSSNTAKVRLTAPIASPEHAIAHRTHDGFSLVVLTLQLMYGYRPYGALPTRGHLRYVVNQYVKDTKMAKMLRGLVKDDLSKCLRVSDLLYNIYGIKVDCPRLKIEPNLTLDIELDNMVQKHVDILEKKYKFKRSSRCRYCSVSILSRLKINDRKQKIYVTTMAYIFACVFEFTEILDRDKRMSSDDVSKYANCTEEEMLNCINTILKTKDIINWMFAP